MRTRSHPRAVAAAGACAAAAIMALTACDPAGDPTPPTTTAPTTQPADDPTTLEPTEEPAQSYRDQQIEAAKEFVLDFYATSNGVAQDGYENWEPRLFPFFTGNEELWQQQSGGYRQSAEEGLSIEGEVEVYSIEATDWEQAPEDAEGFDTVTFNLCVDSRSVVNRNEDGTKNTDITLPDHRFPTAIEVMGQPDAELGWSLMTFEADSESSC